MEEIARKHEGTKARKHEQINNNTNKQQITK